jgi:hypothetical protein
MHLDHEILSNISFTSLSLLLIEMLHILMLTKQLKKNEDSQSSETKKRNLKKTQKSRT